MGHMQNSKVTVKDFKFKNESCYSSEIDDIRSITIKELFDNCDSTIEALGSSILKNVDNIKFPTNKPVIYDSASDQFVGIKKIIKNPDQANWVRLEVDGIKKPIYVTSNTWLQACSNVDLWKNIQASNLTIKHSLVDSDGKYHNINTIKFMNYLDENIYDIETESGFDVDGIRIGIGNWIVGSKDTNLKLEKDASSPIKL